MQTKKELVIDTLEKDQNYIEELYKKCDSLRREEFVRRTEWKDFVPVIEDDTARFLKVVLQMKRPRRILEIGTSIGFSATTMALTAKEYGGTITTVEFDPKAYDQAKKNFIRAGVDDTITMLLGDAVKIVPEFSKDSFDLIFQDVDNRLYPALLNDCIRILKPGGILIADDTLFPVMELEDRLSNQIEPIERFNRLVASSEQLESTLLPIGDGVTICVKK